MGNFGPTLSGIARVTGTAAVPTLSGLAFVTVEPANLANLHGDVVIDTEFVDHLFPGRGASGVQLVAFGIVVASPIGVISPADIVGGFEFERDAERGASLSFAVRADKPVTGTEMDWKGPPLGKLEIDVYGGYLTSSGVKWHQLADAMVADASDRQIGPGGVMNITAIGPRFRYDCARGSYVLDDGHGKRQGEVVRELVDMMGVPDAKNWVQSGSTGVGKTRFYNSVQIDDRELMPVAEQIGDCEDAVLRWTRTGGVQLARKTVHPNEVDQSLITTLTEVDLLMGSELTISAPGGTRATTVRIKGEEVTKSEECGRTVRVFESTVSNSDVIPIADSKQDAAGAISSVIGFDITGERVKIKTVTTQEWECDTLIFQRVQVFEWHNPRAWRYTIDATGAISGYQGNVFFFEAGVAKDDTAEAYQWAQARFVQTSQVDTFYDYSTGSLGLNLPATTQFDEGGLGRFRQTTAENLGLTAPAGALFRIRTFRSGYILRESALKDGPPGTGESWEDVAFINGKTIFGGGAGAMENESYYGHDASKNLFWNRTPTFIGFEQVTEQVTEDAFKTQESKDLHDLFLVEGDSWYYLDGSTSKYEDYGSSDPTGDVPLLAQSEATNWSGDEKKGVTAVTLSVDHRTGKSVVTTDDSQDHLPKATLRQDDATRVDRQSFCVEATSSLLEARNVECLVDYSNPFLRESQALRRALYELRQQSALQFSVQSPMNLWAEPFTHIGIYLRRYGVNFRGQMKNVKISRADARAPIISTISGDIYVV